MKVSKRTIVRYLGKWQPLLRLADWDISVHIVKKRWRKSGDVKVDLEDRKAIILINQKPVCENIEELIVHELLHIKLYGLDQMIDDLLCTLYGRKKSKKRVFAYMQFMSLLEATVEDLTKGVLAANGRRKPLSFGRLRGRQ
jgi:hypothetical protein